MVVLVAFNKKRSCNTFSKKKINMNEDLIELTDVTVAIDHAMTYIMA